MCSTCILLFIHKNNGNTKVDDDATDDVVTDDLIEVAVTTAGTGVTYAVVTLGFALP